MKKKDLIDYLLKNKVVVTSPLKTFKSFGRDFWTAMVEEDGMTNRILVDKKTLEYFFVL